MARMLQLARMVSFAQKLQRAKTLAEEDRMVRMTRIAMLLPAVLMVVSGCATRDWVRDLIGKKDAEIGETRALAQGAGERADSAMAKAGSVDSRLTRLWSNRYNQKAVDTVEIYFGFDQAELSDGAQTALVGVVKELEASPTLVVKLGGFTDPKGAKTYNYLLAQRRVEAVRRFLADKGVQLSRVQAIGMGALDDRGTPDEKKRRVTVTLMVDSE